MPPRKRFSKIYSILSTGILSTSLLLVIVLSSCQLLNPMAPTQTIKPFMLRTPFDSAIDYQQKLQQAGVPNQLIITDSGGFAWDIHSVEQPLDQELEQLATTIADFFDQYITED